VPYIDFANCAFLFGLNLDKLYICATTLQEDRDGLSFSRSRRGFFISAWSGISM